MEINVHIPRTVISSINRRGDARTVSTLCKKTLASFKALVSTHGRMTYRAYTHNGDYEARDRDDRRPSANPQRDGSDEVLSD